MKIRKKKVTERGKRAINEDCLAQMIWFTDTCRKKVESKLINLSRLDFYFR